MVTTGMAVPLSWFLRDVRPPFSLPETFWILLVLWQGNWDASRVEEEIPVAVSCCGRDLVVSIDFPGESGIVSC